MPDTTVFQSGNSQAVRLPKEFRFKSKTVEIFRRGEEVVLREKPRTVGDLLDEALAGALPLTAKDRVQFDEAMTIARAPQPQQQRDWDAMFNAPAAPSPRRRNIRR